MYIFSLSISLSLCVSVSFSLLCYCLDVIELELAVGQVVGHLVSIFVCLCFSLFLLNVSYNYLIFSFIWHFMQALGVSMLIFNLYNTLLTKFPLSSLQKRVRNAN